MHDPQLLDVMRAAIRGTEERLLKWTVFDQDTFRVDMGPGTLRIGREYEERHWSTDEGDGSDTVTVYQVWVMNEKAQVVMESTFDPTDSAPVRRDQYPLAERLFRCARESGMRTREVLKGMLDFVGTK